MPHPSNCVSTLNTVGAEKQYRFEQAEESGTRFFCRNRPLIQVSCAPAILRIPKRGSAMVFLLVGDIALDSVNMGETDRKGAVPRLPCEGTVLRERLMNPFRRIGFDEPDSGRNGQVPIERTEQMNVIRHAARGDEDAFLGAQDAANVFVEPGLQVGGDEREAILGTED
jgi:hypothetical protein